MSADAKLDRAIALARKLAQDPRVKGATLNVACAWDDGRPNCVHGALSIHVDAGTPAEAWVAVIAPARRDAVTFVGCEGREITSWSDEVEGVRVGVYLSAPLSKEVPCAPAA